MKKTTIILGGVFSLLLACGGKDLAYLHSQEERNVCHKVFSAGDWYPKQYNDIPLWLAYKDHIGMHPNDYWGRCKEEIVPIPDIMAYPTMNEEGEWEIERIRPRGKTENRNR